MDHCQVTSTNNSNLLMKNSCILTKILYYLFFVVFITTLVLFLAQFWIWGDIVFRILNDTTGGSIFISDKEEAVIIASIISQVSFYFFVSKVFPTALIYAITLFILNFFSSRIRSRPNYNHNYISLFNMLEILRVSTVSFITLYGVISWFLIPINFPDIVLAMLTYIHIIWQAMAPYYYAYFILLTLISILSHVRVGILQIRNTLLERIGFYKNFCSFFRSYK